MTDEEVNKIITDYMGSHKKYRRIEDSGLVTEQIEYVKYTESLDLLVPVLNKITEEKSQGFWLNINRHGVADYHIGFFVQDQKDPTKDIDFFDSGDISITQVAAHGAAKLIKVLND